MEPERIKIKYTHGKSEGNQRKVRSHSHVFTGENTEFMHQGMSPSVYHRKKSTHTNMHWYILIPTSNIRLLCLTYTFSPFIRLIRLFWKKWRRKGKVRDMVVIGTNVTLHTASTTWQLAKEHAGSLEHHRRTMAYTYWVLLLFHFSFSTCALSSASSSWSDCQHQERAGNKVLPCKWLWGWRTTVYINLLKGGTSLRLLTNAISSLQTTTFPHTNDKA